MPDMRPSFMEGLFSFLKQGGHARNRQLWFGRSRAQPLLARANSGPYSFPTTAHDKTIFLLQERGRSVDSGN